MHNYKASYSSVRCGDYRYRYNCTIAEAVWYWKEGIIVPWLDDHLPHG